MSETTSLANGNNEPSMEDILSSIRKVIAEDATNVDEAIGGGAEDLMTATESPDESVKPEPVQTDVFPDTSVSDILDLDDVITELPDPAIGIGEQDETLELVTLDDEPISDQNSDLTETSQQVVDPDSIFAHERKPQYPESADLDSPQSVDEGDNDFDASLDLVMDADASDYVTTNLASEEGMKIEDWRQQGRQQNTDSDIELPEADEDLVKALNESIEEVTSQAVTGAVTAEFSSDTDLSSDLSSNDDITRAAEDLSGDNSEDSLIVESDAPVAATEAEQQMDVADDSSGQTATTPDDDMDLVKSLLADLMDEPIAEENTNTLETESLEPEFADENIFEDQSADSLVEEGLNLSDTDDETEVETEPDQNVSLKQIAEEIESAGEAEENGKAQEAATNPDDVIDLDSSDILSKLALTATAGAGAGAVAATMAAQDTPTDSVEDTPTETDTQPTTSAPQTAEEQIQEDVTQKENTMATPLKTETLTDDETREEAGNAFASLTSAVAEKNLRDENGPAIGELVKEALKPMLQEWLDKNLKSMVQRAVNAEIKRISSGK